MFRAIRLSIADALKGTKQTTRGTRSRAPESRENGRREIILRVGPNSSDLPGNYDGALSVREDGKLRS